MEEWKEYKLGDVLTIKYGKDHKQLADGDIPIYGSGGIMRYGERSLYDGPSILIPRKGSLNNVIYADKPFWTVDTMFWSIINASIANPLFVYYSICKKDFASLNVGSAVPSLTVPVIEDIDILLPSKATQDKVVSVLKSLDDKIELNRHINDNLEQQAQALFKSWFVDFEPFLREEFFKSDSLFGDIPVEWHIVAIKDLSVYITDYVANGSFASLRENVRLYDKPNYAHFIRNTDLKAESYKMYVDKHSYEFLSKSVLEGGEIIISNVGDVGSVFLCPKLEKPMTLGNNIILLRPKKDYLTFYLYMLFKGGIGQHLIDGVTGGSAQRKFNKTDFKSIKLMIPPVNILIKFDRIVKPIFSKIEENRDEISRLTSLRDTLLPKLMSGELKINDINN